MKNSAILLLAFALLISSGVQLLKPSAALAQTSNNGTLVILQAGSPSLCAQPSGATVTNGLTLCATSIGLYYAVNGATAFNPVAGTAAAPPVVSVFGRTGTISSASGDYSYAQLSSPPTTLSCTTASLSTGSTGTLNASGCTIK